MDAPSVVELSAEQFQALLDAFESVQLLQTQQIYSLYVIPGAVIASAFAVIAFFFLKK